MRIPSFDNIAYSSIRFGGNEIEVIRLNHLVADDQWKVHFHKHTYFELHYVLEGNAYTQFRDRDMEVPPGFFYIIRPGLIHAHEQKAGTTHQAFTMAWKIHNVQQDDYLHQTLHNASHQCILDDGSVYQEIERLARETEYQAPQEMLKLNVCRLLYAVAMRHQDKPVQQPNVNMDSNLIQEALVFMNDNVASDLKATDIAAAIHVSYAHLSRLFSKSLGTSVKKMYNDMKMRRAEELLHYSNLRVEEIAPQCGFKNLNYFYEMFKRETGMTPMEFRKQNNADIMS